MTLAISTSWNAHRCIDGEQLLFEITALGFKAIELSFNLSAGLLESISRHARRQGIHILSLHNYCPVPAGLSPAQALPDCYSLASLDESERLLAVKYTKVTIDTAAGLGAQAVVLHCGRVQVADATRHLIDLYYRGQQEKKEFTGIKEEMLRQRNASAPAFLEQVLRSLDELNTHAKNKNISLGVETRFYYCEIPGISEIGIILKQFSNSQIYYWHDTGHAQLMENLGFAKHKDFLELYAGRLLGVHIHDIRGCQDHLAPGTGTMDFESFKLYFKKDTIKVIEAHYPAGAAELKRSRDLISRIYDAD
jgi:sugar phosphate isomerase/epimerase